LQAKADESDLVQDTLLQAHKDFPAFRGQTSASLYGWLRGILHHLCLQFVRRFRDGSNRQSSREVPLPHKKAAESLVADDSTPSQTAARQEEADLLRETFLRLPPHDQQVIALHYFKELSFAEVGRQMGSSEEAARKLWGRAVDRLAAEGGLVVAVA
jgi:RNA polymerase sigma-70 factor (ECF subfamily)